MKALATLIASGFGSGYAPKSPGTCGSILALALWLLLCHLKIVNSAEDTLALALIATIIGFWATAYAIKGECVSGKIDPQWIVIDEWAGIFIALTPCTVGDWLHSIVAFIAFRFFDISKLGLIGRAERLPHAHGIMADDLVAGTHAALITLLAVQFL